MEPLQGPAGAAQEGGGAGGGPGALPAVPPALAAPAPPTVPAPLGEKEASEEREGGPGKGAGEVPCGATEVGEGGADAMDVDGAVPTGSAGGNGQKATAVAGPPPPADGPEEDAAGHPSPTAEGVAGPGTGPPPVNAPGNDQGSGAVEAKSKADRAPEGAEPPAVNDQAGSHAEDATRGGSFVSPELRGRGARQMRNQMEKEFKEAQLGRCSAEQGRIPGEDEGELFMRSLTEFLQDMLGVTVGSVGWKVPKLREDEIDLCKLYREVALQGGFLAVSSAHRWKRICYCFTTGDESQMEYGSYRVKTIYEKWLLAYENHYLDMDVGAGTENLAAAPKKALDFMKEETVAAQEKSAATMKVARKMLKQFFPSCGPLAVANMDIDASNEVIASLKGSDLGRKSWALNYLLVVTHGVQTEFCLSTKPGLLVALMKISSALNSEETLMSMPDLGSDFAIAGQEAWWWEDAKCGVLNCRRDVEIAAQHAVLAMTIVHNLSFFESNRLEMAIDSFCMKGLLNAGWTLAESSPSDIFYAEKRMIGDLALVAFQNLAKKINISEKRFDSVRTAVCRMLNLFLMAFITHDYGTEPIEEGTRGMGLCLRGFGLLLELMSNSRNALSLAQKFGKTMVRVAQALLSQPDDAIVLKSLEFLYRLLSFASAELRDFVLGQPAVIARLVSLLTSGPRSSEVIQEVMTIIRSIVRGPVEVKLFEPLESTLLRVATSTDPNAVPCAHVLKLCCLKSKVKKKNTAKPAPAPKKKYQTKKKANDKKKYKKKVAPKATKSKKDIYKKKNKKKA